MDASASPTRGNDDLEPAPDRPPVFALLVLMLATTAFVVLAGLAVKTALVMRTASEVQSKTGIDAELSEILSSAAAARDRYDAIDATAGAYQVPVTRAMEMVVRDPALLDPIAPAAPTAPAAPATPEAAAAAPAGH